MTCVDHAWDRHPGLTRGTHFVDEPNSKRRSRPVVKYVCLACSQLGYRYPPSRVLYTWRRDPAHWLDDTT